MFIQNKMQFVLIAEIKKKDRQRKVLNNLEELSESIQQIGLINPITLNDTAEGLFLVAGERRLEAHKLHGATRILARIFKDLPEAEVQRVEKIVELEENVKRQDLHWKEHCLAVLDLHELMEKPSPKILAKELSISAGHVGRLLAVAKALRNNDEQIGAAEGMAAAYRIVERRTARAIDTELSQLDSFIAGGTSVPGSVSSFQEDDAANSSGGELSVRETAVSIVPPASASAPVLAVNFLEWAPAYTGRKFNFLHCDFPYGINHQKSAQGRSLSWGAYDDAPDVYWALLQCLADNLDKILFLSAHVVFWYSFNFHQETVSFFKEKTDLVVNPFPLIWVKSDNRGLLPDPERGPRRIYETALLMSRGDRKIIKPVSNAYVCPTGEKEHLSQKPEPMLRYFFRMLVDDSTELLDPTAGSGTALRAADALKAKRLVGLEVNEEFVSNANSSFLNARRLRLANLEITEDG